MKTETTFKCNHCEFFFKNCKGLKIHIGKTHKSSNLKIPTKEQSTFVLEEPTLTLTSVTENSREEINTPFVEFTINAEGDEVGQHQEYPKLLGTQVQI